MNKEIKIGQKVNYKFGKKDVSRLAMVLSFEEGPGRVVVWNYKDQEPKLIFRDMIEDYILEDTEITK